MLQISSLFGTSSKVVKTVPNIRETVKELTNLVTIEAVFKVPSKK